MSALTNLVERAGIMMRNLGGDDRQVEYAMELQRAHLEPERDIYIGKLRSWFERGCEGLH